MGRLNELDPIGPSYGMSKEPSPEPRPAESEATKALKMIANMNIVELDDALNTLSAEQKARLKNIFSGLSAEENFTEFDFSTAPTRMDEAYTKFNKRDK